MIGVIAISASASSVGLSSLSGVFAGGLRAVSVLIVVIASVIMALPTSYNVYYVLHCSANGVPFTIYEIPHTARRVGGDRQ